MKVPVGSVAGVGDGAVTRQPVRRVSSRRRAALRGVDADGADCSDCGGDERAECSADGAPRGARPSGPPGAGRESGFLGVSWARARRRWVAEIWDGEAYALLGAPLLCQCAPRTHVDSAAGRSHSLHLPCWLGAAL